MFSALNNLLNVNPNFPPSGKSILVTEQGTDGSLVIHHLISTYLKGGHCVCLVGLAQTFTHYSCVANKFSLNVTACKDAGQLVFVDALAIIGSSIVEGRSRYGSDKNSPETTDDGLTSSLCLPLGASETRSRQSLKCFYETIKNALETLPNWRSKPTLLIVDELSLLVLLGYQPFAVSILVHYLRLLVCPSESSQGAFATLIHSNQQTNDEQIELLQKLVGHNSELLIHVDQLKTGYCREVSGEITVENRNTCSGTRKTSKERMHFKLTDKNIALFPVGMSGAVL